MQLYWIVSLAAALIVAVFAIQNGESLKVTILFWSVKTSIPVLVFVSAAAGAVIMFFLGLPRQIRNWRELRTLRADGKTLRAEQELSQRRIAELTASLPKPSASDDESEKK